MFLSTSTDTFLRNKSVDIEQSVLFSQPGDVEAE